MSVPLEINRDHLPYPADPGGTDGPLSCAECGVLIVMIKDEWWHIRRASDHGWVQCPERACSTRIREEDVLYHAAWHMEERQESQR